MCKDCDGSGCGAWMMVGLKLVCVSSRIMSESSLVYIVDSVDYDV